MLKAQGNFDFSVHHPFNNACAYSNHLSVIFSIYPPENQICLTL